MGKIENHTRFRSAEPCDLSKAEDIRHRSRVQGIHRLGGNALSTAENVTERKGLGRVSKFNNLLDQGLSKSIFDHLRNYLMCSFLLAIGVSEFKQETGLFFDVVSSIYAGATIIALSCVLFCLNLYDGIRNISQYKYHAIYTFGLVVAYVIMSIGVIEIAASFRAAL